MHHGDISIYLQLLTDFQDNESQHLLIQSGAQRVWAITLLVNSSYNQPQESKIEELLMS